MGTSGSTVLEPLWRGLPALDAQTLSGSATCALSARYEAVRSAREFTRRTLRRWSLSQEYDNVALVVSELVTNALRHGLPELNGPGGTDRPGGTGGRNLNGSGGGEDTGGGFRPGHGPGHGHDGPQDPPVRLHLMRWSARLVCAVRDPSKRPPEAAGQDDGLREKNALRLPVALDEGTGLSGLDDGTGPGTLDGGGADVIDLDCFPDSAAESGRGLHLVNSFSDCWGWHLLTGAPAGKVVWAMFRLAPS